MTDESTEQPKHTFVHNLELNEVGLLLHIEEKLRGHTALAPLHGAVMKVLSEHSAIAQESLAEAKKDEDAKAAEEKEKAAAERRAQEAQARLEADEAEKKEQARLKAQHEKDIEIANAKQTQKDLTGGTE